MNFTIKCQFYYFQLWSSFNLQKYVVSYKNNSSLSKYLIATGNIKRGSNLALYILNFVRRKWKKKKIN